ncbi:MAG: PilZ domain-containing protein [Armatimonadota bacterium]
MRKARRGSADLRITVFVEDGAVLGRITEFTETGAVAVMDATVPLYDRLEFTLHVPGGVVSGQVTALSCDGRDYRLQFAALSDRDRQRLEPWTSPA